jgi:GntR family transcriptional regulator/MocR family aminotransferase
MDRVPRAALARAYRRALGRAAGPGSGSVLGSVLDYGDPAGHPALRAALARMLRDARALCADADDVLVTRGSQMALDLIARVLSRPGDVIAVESLGYRPAWQALGAYGAKLAGVDVDAQGLRVDRLEALSERMPLRAVYVTPHHQYPTAVPLSAGRRLALLDLARRKRFAIIEDDHAHEFHYDGRPLSPLASADDAGVVIYVGTLSKVLSPGLRTGYVVAPRALLTRLIERRRYVDRQGDLPTELALAELLEDGEVARHARRMRRLYQRRRDAMLAAIGQHLAGAVFARTPPGGMALWARVAREVDLEAWVESAARHGLSLKPARAYALDDRSRPFVRLSFTGRREEVSEQALRRLAACLPARAARRAAGRRAASRQAASRQSAQGGAPKSASKLSDS